MFFTGYDGVPDFFQALLHLIQSTTDVQNNVIQQTFHNQSACDSHKSASTNGSSSHSHHTVEPRDEAPGKDISSQHQPAKVTCHLNGLCHDIPVNRVTESLAPALAAPTNGTSTNYTY